MSAKQLQNVDLSMVEGSHNKYYNVSLLENPNGTYTITVQRGRIGSSCISDIKGDGIPTLDKAEKSYLSLVRSKLAKGYKAKQSNPLDLSSPTVAKTVNTVKQIKEKVDSGLVLQLLNDADDTTLEQCLKSPAWGLQEKMDGNRLCVEHDGEVKAINKKGILIQAIDSHITLIKSVGVSITVDGENVGGKYYIFDLISYDGQDLRDLSVLARYNKLLEIPELANNVVPMYFDEASKRAKFEEVRARGGEGVVFKQISSKYVGGRPTKGGMQLKYKFWKSDTFIVSSIHATKSSIGISTIKDGASVVIGNATIPPNYPFPKLGNFVEIIYLYCYPNGGSIYQPKYKGIRNDQDESDCQYSKLKFKAIDGDDD